MTKIQIGNYQLRKDGDNWHIEENAIIGTPSMGHTKWKNRGTHQSL
jgi:hypothetical protein